MRLTLSRGIPLGHALTTAMPQVGGATLAIDGISYLDQGYSFRIGFRDRACMPAAAHSTGWPQLGEGQPVLDTGPAAGYGGLVLVAKGIAYHAFTLDTEPAPRLLTLDAAFNVPLPQHGGPVRSCINLEGNTNGPWHVEPLDGNEYALAICASGQAAGVIAEIHREDDGLSAHDYADAALLAAAPAIRARLYAALDLLAQVQSELEDEEEREGSACAAAGQAGRVPGLMWRGVGSLKPCPAPAARLRDGWRAGACCR